jgi:ribosomal protein L19
MLGRLLGRQIVNWNKPRRSPFDRTNYIEDYEAPLIKKHTRLALWDDPDFHWPVHIEPKSPLRCKGLLRQVEDEYNQAIKRPWPEFFSGDIIETTYYLALSTQTTATVKGIVIGLSKGNTLNASFHMMSFISGSHFEMKMKFNSPMLKEIKLIERGSGRQRKKLNHILDWPITAYHALGFSKKRKFAAKEEAKRLRQNSLSQDK